MDRKPPKVPKLVVLAGLPGVGKTTLAQRLAKASDTTYLRIDSIEQAMARNTLKISPAEDAGYEVAYHVAKDNLLLGHDVVADSVNPIQITRTAWTNVAGQCDAQLIQVEIVCSNKTEHHRRVEGRLADIENHRMPTWEDFKATLMITGLRIGSSLILRTKPSTRHILLFWRK